MRNDITIPLIIHLIVCEFRLELITIVLLLWYYIIYIILFFRAVILSAGTQALLVGMKVETKAFRKDNLKYYKFTYVRGSFNVRK